MANEILVTPEQLREKAKEIRALKEGQVGIMRKITNLVYSLSQIWSGAAQTAFVQKYTSMQPTYTSFQNAIEEFAVLMEEHADRMEKADNDMALKIRQI